MDSAACTLAVFWVRSASSTNVVGRAAPELNYNVMNDGRHEHLSTRVDTRRPTGHPSSGTNNRRKHADYYRRANYGRRGRRSVGPARLQQLADMSVRGACVRRQLEYTPLLVSGTQRECDGRRPCTIGNVYMPAADSATIPVNSSGVVDTSAINRSYANIMCSSPANVQFTSLNGAVKAAASAVAGFANFINYSASASFFSANATLNTATIPTATGPESGTRRIDFGQHAERHDVGDHHAGDQRQSAAPRQLFRHPEDHHHAAIRFCTCTAAGPQLNSLTLKYSPPFGVSVTVPLMPGGSVPAYSGRKRRSKIESASVFSTWLMAPPMHERFPPPKGI